MAGPIGQGGQSLGVGPINQVVAQAMNHPFVGQQAQSPYGGYGSAYTIDVLNSLQPLGVNPNQYPGGPQVGAAAPAAAPAPASTGINPLGIPSTPGGFSAPGMGPRDDRSQTQAYTNPMTGQVTYGSKQLPSFAGSHVDPNFLMGRGVSPAQANGQLNGTALRPGQTFQPGDMGQQPAMQHPAIGQFMSLHPTVQHALLNHPMFQTLLNQHTNSAQPYQQHNYSNR